MLLVIDAGNTNIVFAAHDGTEWRGTWRLATSSQRTSDEYWRAPGSRQCRSTAR